MKRERSFLRRLWRASGSALRALLKEDTPRDAAAISYFGLISLFPSILLLIALADTFLGWSGQRHEEIIRRIISLFPASRHFLDENLTDLTDPSPALTISCMVVVIWCTSWICAFIENALNRAWRVTRRRSFWENRIRGMALLAVGGMCLLVSVAFNAFVSAVQVQSATRIPASAEPVMRWFWSFIPLAAGFLIAVFVFALIYKLMPGFPIPWFEAWYGSVAAAIIWELGSYIFVKAIAKLDYGRVYGKAGAVIALLAWVYTSSLIMLYGAHFTAQLHQSGD